MGDCIVGAYAVEGDGQGVGKRGGRRHTHAQASEWTWTYAGDHRIEVGILHFRLGEDLGDGGDEQLIMSAGIFQYALGGLPSGGIYYPGDQGGSCRVDREDAH